MKKRKIFGSNLKEQLKASAKDRLYNFLPGASKKKDSFLLAGLQIAPGRERMFADNNNSQVD